MKRLGIIGGMGPMATIDLYKKIVELTPATRDQDHIPMVIDNYPQIEDRTGHIVRGEANPLPRLTESAKRLEAAGAEALLMPCNTAHYFADDITREVRIPIIHIVECTAEAIKANYPNARRIGLIATTGTKKARVYENILKRYGFEIIELPEDLENSIMSCIYDGVKAGKTVEYAPLFQECINRVSSLGADVMIAGCTEIPLLLPYIKSDVPFVDATLELARAAVKFAKE